MLTSNAVLSAICLKTDFDLFCNIEKSLWPQVTEDWQKSLMEHWYRACSWLVTSFLAWSLALNQKRVFVVLCLKFEIAQWASILKYCISAFNASFAVATCLDNWCCTWKANCFFCLFYRLQHLFSLPFFKRRLILLAADESPIPEVKYCILHDNELTLNLIRFKLWSIHY